MAPETLLVTEGSQCLKPLMQIIAVPIPA